MVYIVWGQGATHSNIKNLQMKWKMIRKKNFLSSLGFVEIILPYISYIYIIYIIEVFLANHLASTDNLTKTNTQKHNENT